MTKEASITYHEWEDGPASSFVPSIRRRQFLRLLPAAALCGCGDDRPAAESKFPKVKRRVTSTTPFTANLVSTVGGEAVDSKSFVPPGENVQTFVPTAADSAKFHTSDMIFTHGLGLESRWPVDFETLGKDGVRVFAATSMIPAERIIRPSGPGGPPDPHVWMHPELAAMMVDAVEAALKEVMPKLGDYFTPRAHKLRLAFEDALKAEAQKMKELKPDDLFLLTSHDSMQYFAAAFGLEARALAAPAANLAEKLPADLVEWITTHHVKSLFRESFTDVLVLRHLLEDVKVNPDHLIYSLTLPATATTALVGFKSYDIFTASESLYYSADLIQSTLEVD